MTLSTLASQQFEAPDGLRSYNCRLLLATTIIFSTAILRMDDLDDPSTRWQVQRRWGLGSYNPQHLIFPAHRLPRGGSVRSLLIGLLWPLALALENCMKPRPSSLQVLDKRLRQGVISSLVAAATHQAFLLHYHPNAWMGSESTSITSKGHHTIENLFDAGLPSKPTHKIRSAALWEAHKRGLWGRA